MLMSRLMMRTKFCYFYALCHHLSRIFGKLLSIGKDSITLEDVKKFSLSKELMDRELIREGDVKSEALFIRGRSMEKGSNNNKNKFRSKSKARSKFCNYCKKKGHILEECYKLQNKEKRKNDNKNQGKPDADQANVANEDSYGFVLLAINESKYKNE